MFFKKILSIFSFSSKRLKIKEIKKEIKKREKNIKKKIAKNIKVRREIFKKEEELRFLKQANENGFKENGVTVDEVYKFLKKQSRK